MPNTGTAVCDISADSITSYNGGSIFSLDGLIVLFGLWSSWCPLVAVRVLVFATVAAVAHVLRT